MSLVFAHLCLASLLVGSLALLSRLLLPRMQSRPVVGYWLVLGAIGLGLTSSGTQVLLQGRGRPTGLPFVERVMAVGHGLGESEVFATSPEMLAPQPDGGDWSMHEIALLAAMLEADDALMQPPLAAHSQAAPPAGINPSPTNWPGWIAGLYLAGLSLALLHVLRQALRSWRLLRHSRLVTNKRVRRVWASLPGRSQGIRLREVPQLALPACTGLLRRTILLPQAVCLPRDENALRCILTHELVHLQRGDAWGLLLQETFRVLFWFHPAAWWLIAQLDLMRELSCDQLVVQRTKLRKGYAEALLHCAAGLDAGRGYRSAAHNSVALVPLTRSQTQLRRRIEMLFSSKLSKGARASWVTIGLASSAASVLCLSQVALAAGYQAESQIEAQDAGVVLEVRPTVSPDRRFVTLDIQPSVLEDDSLLHEPLALETVAKLMVEVQGNAEALQNTQEAEEEELKKAELSSLLEALLKSDEFEQLLFDDETPAENIRRKSDTAEGTSGAIYTKGLASDLEQAFRTNEELRAIYKHLQDSEVLRRRFPEVGKLTSKEGERFIFEDESFRSWFRLARGFSEQGQGKNWKGFSPQDLYVANGWDKLTTQKWAEIGMALSDKAQAAESQARTNWHRAMDQYKREPWLQSWLQPRLDSVYADKARALMELKHQVELEKSRPDRQTIAIYLAKVLERLEGDRQAGNAPETDSLSSYYDVLRAANSTVDRLQQDREGVRKDLANVLEWMDVANSPGGGDADRELQRDAARQLLRMAKALDAKSQEKDFTTTRQRAFLEAVIGNFSDNHEAKPEKSLEQRVHELEKQLQERMADIEELKRRIQAKKKRPI